MKEVSKSYCRVPFDSITVTPTGRMQMCCEAQWTALLSTEKTSIKDLDSIENWLNGDYLNNVRKSMLEGKLLPECVTCYKNEKLYGRSVRTTINKEYFAKNNNTTEIQKLIKDQKEKIRHHFHDNVNALHEELLK